MTVLLVDVESEREVIDEYEGVPPNVSETIEVEVWDNPLTSRSASFIVVYRKVEIHKYPGGTVERRYICECSPLRRSP